MVPGCCFSPDLEAMLSACVSDEVHCHVFDCGHVSWPVVGAQTHQVVVEHHVKHPVQPVFDAPMGADGAGEKGGIEGKGGEEEAPRDGGLAAAFDLGLDHD